MTQAEAMKIRADAMGICIRRIQAISDDWKTDGQMQKVYACDYLIQDLRALAPDEVGS